jgi:hypothetical protein
VAKGRKTGGRTKGTPNKITRNTREMLAFVVDENLPLASAWLKEAWTTKPIEAVALFKAILEYAAPKFGRVDPVADANSREAADTRSVDEIRDAELEAVIRAARDPNAAVAVYTALMDGESTDQAKPERYCKLNRVHPVPAHQADPSPVPASELTNLLTDVPTVNGRAAG